MTHLSDFSFLQRMVSFGYLYVWYTYRVWTLDKFRCLHPKRFRQGELKSIVTMLILFMIPFQLFYDITSTKIKYEEGFANVLGHIFTKPEIMWTAADKSLVVPTEYSLCIGFSLQTGTLVLLQCFWNYLANSVAKASFMSSKEFMFYICWTFSSFIIFPVLQYNFSREIYEPTYKEIIPEMVYGIELFIVGCLGVVSHFRFKKLLSNSRDTVNGRSITHKIRYFQEVNVVLSTVLFGHGILLTILSGDGLTGRKTLNIHKFSADFFICNINMCAVITWFCMILIFHPKHNNSAEAEDEQYKEESSTPINNCSTISDANTYAHAPTLVIGNSQASSEYMYKTGSAIHPLSKSGTTTSSQMINCDSAFQFGPLPIAPPHASDTHTINYRKNNSIASTAPSMTTLVSHHQMGINHGSNGKSNSIQYNGGIPRSIKGSIGGGPNEIDYFQVAMPTNDEKSIMPTVDVTENYYHHQLYPEPIHINRTSALPPPPTPSAQQPMTLQPIKHYEELELAELEQKKLATSKKAAAEEEYVPPPLSPARKSRGDITVHSLRADQDRRRYTHSMMIAPCNEDMGEFGVKLPQPPSNDDEYHSFHEFGNDSTLIIDDGPPTTKKYSINHSTSSLLLPLPFELGQEQDHSRMGNPNSAFGFIAPPPATSPPLPPHPLPPTTSNPFNNKK